MRYNFVQIDRTYQEGMTWQRRDKLMTTPMIAPKWNEGQEMPPADHIDFDGFRISCIDKRLTDLDEEKEVLLLERARLRFNIAMRRCLIFGNRLGS